MQLRQYIEPRGVATQLAKACGVSLSTITRIASGAIEPKPRVIRLIVQHTAGAVSADDILAAPSVAAE